jgi:hypothetical protein
VWTGNSRRYGAQAQREDSEETDLKNPLIRCLLGGLAILPAVAVAQTVPLTQDAYFSPGSPTNFGSSTTINVGGPNASQALAQFDLTALPAGTTAANVSRAILALFVNKLGAPGTINISEANGAWVELTVNGTGGAPVPGTAVATAVPVSTVSDYVYVDATSAVQDWLTNGGNNGFIITGNDGMVNVAFDSKESTTTSHPATLTITLSAVGTIGPTGAVGPTGATGSTGPAGTTGAAGATGVAGPAGTTGAAGATGVAGPAGTTGAAGATGVAGPAGTTGAAGATGVAGPAGTTGAAGATGPAGANGPAGAAGPTGAQGPAGAQGPPGLNGQNGTTGATGPAGSNGTGAAPTGIPVTIAGHSGLSAFFSPTSPSASTAAAFSATDVAVAPTACKPSLTIWNYSGALTTYTLFKVTGTGSAMTVTSTIIAQISFTSTTPGVSESTTATSDLTAGELMTLTSGTSTGGTAPGGAGFLSAFSCQ